MTSTKLMAIATVLAGLFGCSSEDQARKQPMPVEQSIFGDQVEQMNKAKQRAEQMEGRVQELNKQLEDVGQ